VSSVFEASKLDNDVIISIIFLILFDLFVSNDLCNTIRFAERVVAGLLKIYQSTVGVSVHTLFIVLVMPCCDVLQKGNGPIEFFSQEKAICTDAQ
jgi:hypothetical protein